LGARLELADGADEDLLAALEQLREPALQAVIALRRMNSQGPTLFLDSNLLDPMLDRGRSEIDHRLACG
jgi:hypothetical protein